MRGAASVFAALTIALGHAACGTSPPLPPDANDPAYTVTARTWLMAGDGLTPRDATLDVLVAAPANVKSVDAWLDGAMTPVALAVQPDGRFGVSLPAPPIGDHTLLLASDGNQMAFATHPFHVSGALYAVVSADWDNSDNLDAYLMNVEAMRKAHPHLVISQFFAPYVFTDPATTQARKDRNVSWMKTQHDLFGDEIGVHVHPYCNFISTVILDGKNLDCHVMPSTNLQGPLPAPNSTVLEVPDNGCLVDYMSAPQMQAVLAANWDGASALATPRVFQIGFHPPDFSGFLLLRMQQTLDTVAKGLYLSDGGPIVHANLSDLVKVKGWPEK